MDEFIWQLVPMGSNDGTSCLFNLCTHYTWKITLESKQNSPPRQGTNKYTNKSSTYFADGKNHSQKKTWERERERKRERERGVCVYVYLWRKVVCLFCLSKTLKSLKPCQPLVELFDTLESLWWVEGCTELVSSHFDLWWSYWILNKIFTKKINLNQNLKKL